MPPSNMPPDVPPNVPPNVPPPESDSAEDELDAELRQIEQSVQELRDRHTQVTTALQAQQTLKVQQARLQHELRQHRTETLKQELAQVKSRMEELELTLESQLFSWGSLSEPFWQAVRFGGLGLLIGWFLRAAVGC